MQKIYYIFLLIALLFILTTLFLSKNEIRSELNSWGLLPTQENFTELYFQNHQKLPISVIPKNTYTFAFTIHNLEKKQFVYRYKVQAINSTKSISLESGHVRLKSGEYKTIDVSFSPQAPLSRTQIQVNLLNKKQLIHFWVQTP